MLFLAIIAITLTLITLLPQCVDLISKAVSYVGKIPDLLEKFKNLWGQQP